MTTTHVLWPLALVPSLKARTERRNWTGTIQFLTNWWWQARRVWLTCYSHAGHQHR